MKANKFFLPIGLSTVLFFSCGKDDDIGNQQLQTLLSKSITNSQTTTYTYDSNNRATGFSAVFSNPINNYTTTYTYNSSGQVAEAYYDNESATATDTKLVYFHNTSGQITKVETYLVTDGVETYDSKLEADYSTVGKVSVYETPLSGMPYLNVEYYLDANGNISSQLSYDASGLLIVTTEYSDYDDNKRASASLPDENFVRSINNFGTVTVTATGGTPSVGTFAYEYNDDGYPTKRTSNTGSVVSYEYIKR